ncbi:hypothetical protein LEMLEM_LOCUS15394 [Lemmus lemmus]
MSVIVVTSCFLIGFVPAPLEGIHLWYRKQGTLDIALLETELALA